MITLLPVALATALVSVQPSTPFSFDRAALQEARSAAHLLEALEDEARTLCTNAHRHGVMAQTRIRTCTNATLSHTVRSIGSSCLSEVWTARAEAKPMNQCQPVLVQTEGANESDVQ